MKKIEHIGIAVKDFEASNKLFSKIFGKSPYKSEEVASEGVITSFFKIGDSKIIAVKLNILDIGILLNYKNIQSKNTFFN